MIELPELDQMSQKMRLDVLAAVAASGRGHVGGALSVIDLLVSVYFSGLFSFGSPGSSRPIQGDSVILSKGHAGVALYAVLAEVGFISRDELFELNKGGLLAEHPSPEIPGVNFVSGSLGHGVSVGAGLALGFKNDNSPWKSLVVVGDGELYEGTNWEAAQFAGHHNLNSLCVLVDRNRLITHGNTENILRLEKLDEKWLSFGWDVRIIDGHKHGEIFSALEAFKQGRYHKPLVVIANTVKGKGVSFMENRPEWHHGPVPHDRLQEALSEIARNPVAP